MKILILADHWAVASGRYATDALRRMGHDIRTDGTPHGNAIWGHTVADEYVWHPEPPERGWKPDLVLAMDSHLDGKRVGKMPHVVYGVDNHVRSYSQFNDWDHLFLGHGNGQRIGEDGVTWLPCGYDAEHFAPGKKWAEREFDVAMIGVMYPERAAMIYELIANIPGIKIRYATGLIYADYAKAYQNSKISLVASANNDVAQRVWETAAMGCLVVKDANDDDEALGLKYGENCLVYTTPGQLVSAVRGALEAPTLSQRIARKGATWAKSGTWEQRLRVIVDWVEGTSGRKAEKAKQDNDG